MQEAAKLEAENAKLRNLGRLEQIMQPPPDEKALFQKRVGEIFAELTADEAPETLFPNEAAAVALRRATAERAAQTATPLGGAPSRLQDSGDA